MAKQTFTSGQVLTAAEMNSLQENDYNWTVTTKTASYTLAAGDEGTRVVMNNAGATTITVDDSVFAAGDVVWLHNIGAGTCTVTAGTATVNTAASLDLAQWEGGSLYFTSASSAIFFRGPAAGVATLEASGGTEVTSGGYKYHTFTSSGTLTVSTAGVCEVLVVAGGGGGSRETNNARGGGGGAGGLVNTTNVYLTDTTWTVTVGAGGAGATGNSQGDNGNASQIGALICAVGGGGAGGYGAGNLGYGKLGGSGGGARLTFGGSTNLGGSGTPIQGNEGGDTSVTTGSGGGGGAGGAGADASANTGGNGGAGSDFSTWATATSTGDSGYFASGGGGSGETTTGTASDGGGGDAANGASNAQSGTANTGGGGGGAESGTAGSGGSGIVIVRYAV